MKLSIISINLNNVDGLRKTVESVCGQSFQDFEYIIIDGGSTDGSLSLIKEQSGFTNEPLRYQWVSELDKGVFNAMNKGISKATGDYLLFLNSGDFLVDNDVLNTVFSVKPDEDILCGRCLISKRGSVVHTTNSPEVFSLSFFYKTSLPHQATFIKRILFEEYGLYREDLKLMSDWEFWIRSIILGQATTRSLDVIISNYNLEGISSDKNNQQITKTEIDTVFDDLTLGKIIPDYISWESERDEMKVMYWVHSKKYLYLPLLYLFQFASWFNSLKNKPDESN